MIGMLYKSTNLMSVFFRTHDAGSIGSVLRSNVYVSFNGRFSTDYGTNDIEYTFPAHFDKLCIVAPKALRIPKWIIMYKCFHWLVWVSIFLVKIICGSLWFLLKRSHIRSRYALKTHTIFIFFNSISCPSFQQFRKAPNQTCNEKRKT